MKLISSCANAKVYGMKWAVLFSNFAIKILNTGLRKSFGVLLLPLQEQFREDVWLIGMIVSISVSIGDFIGKNIRLDSY